MDLGSDPEGGTDRGAAWGRAHHGLCGPPSPTLSRGLSGKGQSAPVAAGGARTEALAPTGAGWGCGGGSLGGQQVAPASLSYPFPQLCSKSNLNYPSQVSLDPYPSLGLNVLTWKVQIKTAPPHGAAVKTE